MGNQEKEIKSWEHGSKRKYKKMERKEMFDVE
jgi:hypothetical protein